MLTDHGKTIAVLGGTGKEGKGLASRWAKAGLSVVIGSRSIDRAKETAAEINAAHYPLAVMGEDNLNAVRAADIVVLSVPYSAHRETLETIRSAMAGKILVDVTVPLVPPKVTKVQMPLAGSAALEAREILGSNAEIASAFQNISYEHLQGNDEIGCDVLVTGTSKETRAVTLDLVAKAGLTGWDAGPLENSLVAEGLTSVLIHINKVYGSTHAGIRITGAANKNQSSQETSK
jgi:8-hydroxy-5-deazaflavin:NADPH oxidoreductase